MSPFASIADGPPTEPAEEQTPVCTLRPLKPVTRMTTNNINKQPMKKHKTNKNGNGSQTIRIEFTDPVAATVAIAGSFNNWRPETTPMVRMDQGRWVKDLALLPGPYEYRLVVDGVWISDPRAGATNPNPFGELNSVLNVKAGPA